MRRALDLAREGLGRVAPNPAVACVIVKDGAVIAEARTANGGRPHAEYLALQEVGAAAKGAQVYVTLEPCAHEGRTPSCARHLAETGIAEIYIATRDLDPRTSGKGAALLKKGGVIVHEGLLAQEAVAVNQGFFTRIEKKRPLIALKIATSLDARIAAADGTSQWITGEDARKEGHRIRARFDGIVTGSGTVLADDPRLTVRFPEYDGPQPLRIVLDRRGRIEPKDDWVVISDYDDMNDCARILYDMGLTRVLIEAGRGVSSAFIKSGLVDEIYWFRAPILLGDQGLPVFDGLDIATLQGKKSFMRQEIHALGEDVLEVYAAIH